MNNLLTIEELSTLSGIPRRTIHFYVQQGLLPAPSGAGLGARYTQEHLQRLKAIPVLRKDGLRLDDIRERFSTMSSAEIASLAPPEDPAQFQLNKIEMSNQLLASMTHYKIANLQEISSDYLFTPPSPRGEEYLHFRFPGGITLIVPREIAENQAEQLAALLRRAGELFGDVDIDNS